MKLMLMALGVVTGIYISLEYPAAAEHIFFNFLEFVNWLGSAVQSFFQGGL